MSRPKDTFIEDVTFSNNTELTKLEKNFNIKVSEENRQRKYVPKKERSQKIRNKHFKTYLFNSYNEKVMQGIERYADSANKGNYKYLRYNLIKLRYHIDKIIDNIDRFNKKRDNSIKKLANNKKKKSNKHTKDKKWIRYFSKLFEIWE